jgi:ketosteroid isomerase-like protein
VGLLASLVEAQNAHDAGLFASYFAEDYRSRQPAHPGRDFAGREQVLHNWEAVFAGVPDFRAEVIASSAGDDVEWGEVEWRGRHTDGSPFAMRGVLILTTRDGLVAEGRLYVEPVERAGDIEDAVDELYRPPRPG